MNVLKEAAGPVGPTRLSNFEVYGLFGQFDYKIPVKLEQRITAIIAPNGSGKTICLRLINALFARKWSFFAGVEFGRVEFHFTSGQTRLQNQVN
jgi:predicted ATP-binding protein involved in virulence